MCVTDRYDMTLAVKVAFNPNTTNQPTTRCHKVKLNINLQEPGFELTNVWTTILASLNRVVGAGSRAQLNAI